MLFRSIPAILALLLVSALTAHAHDPLRALLQCRREIEHACEDAHTAGDRLACVAERHEGFRRGCRRVIRRAMPCLDDASGDGICAPKKDEEPSIEKIFTCLFKNEDKIAKRCKRHLDGLPVVQCQGFWSERCPEAKKNIGEEMACVSKNHPKEAKQCAASWLKLGTSISVDRALLGVHAHRHRMLRRACKQDVDNFCPDRNRNPLQCLYQNREQISSQCLNEAEDSPVFKCGPAMAAFCPGKEGKQVIRCLRSHESEISEQCSAQLVPNKRGGTPLGNELTELDVDDDDDEAERDGDDEDERDGDDEDELDDEEEEGRHHHRRHHRHHHRRHHFAFIFVFFFVLASALAVRVYRQHRSARQEPLAAPFQYGTLNEAL